jgi:hypothetical protein
MKIFTIDVGLILITLKTILKAKTADCKAPHQQINPKVLPVPIYYKN